MPGHRPDEIRAYYDRLGATEWDRFDRTPVEKVKLHLHEVYLRRHVPARGPTGHGARCFLGSGSLPRRRRRCRG